MRVVARAKVTLSLRVLGRRADGFHDLDALMASVGRPRDLLEARLTDRAGEVSLVLAGAVSPHVPTDHTNLALRAAAALAPVAGSAGLELRLVKGIPVMAGLAGGSADAAAALVAVRRLLRSSVSCRELAEIAAGLGSDVPFCLRGGVARVTGRGEGVEALPFPGRLPLLVVSPAFGLSTADVYAAWDRLGGPRDERPPGEPPWAWPAPPGFELMVNDLEPAAFRVEPRLRDFRDQLEALSGARAVLSGSGAAFVLPVATSAAATELAGRVGRSLGAEAYRSALAGRGVALTRALPKGE